MSVGCAKEVQHLKWTYFRIPFHLPEWKILMVIETVFFFITIPHLSQHLSVIKCIEYTSCCRKCFLTAHVWCTSAPPGMGSVVEVVTACRHGYLQMVKYSNAWYIILECPERLSMNIGKGRALNRDMLRSLLLQCVRLDGQQIPDEPRLSGTQHYRFYDEMILMINDSDFLLWISGIGFQDTMKAHTHKCYLWMNWSRKKTYRYTSKWDNASDILY